MAGEQQSKAPKGGRKLKRIPKYKNHYARNFARVTENKAKRIKRHERMVADSRKRHGDNLTARRRRSVEYRHRKVMEA